MATVQINDKFRNRRYKVPAPSLDVLKLLLHFRLQVPGQNDDVRWLRVLEARLVHNRNATARHVLALLCRIAIRYERNQIGPYAGVVHQGVTLGRGPIGGDKLVLALGIQQESKEIVLDFVALGLEAGVVASSGHPGLRFAFQQFVHFGAARVLAGVAALGKHADATSVGGVFFHIEYREPVGGKDPVNRRERQIGKVLVVDGVKLAFGNQLEQVRKLEGCYALGFQQHGKASDEIIDVRHMGQHVVGGSQIGLLALGSQFPDLTHAEEVLHNRDALGAGGGSGAGGGLHPGTGDVAGLDILQQVAVVGGDLYHMAVAI